MKTHKNKYDEDIKLAEVKQGYMELNKELDIKVSPTKTNSNNQRTNKTNRKQNNKLYKENK